MTEYAKPPVALDAKIVGSLFTGDNDAISGSIKIDNVEYAMTVDPTPQKSKNDSEYFRFTAAHRDNGQTSSETAFSGAMFKTRFFGQIGKGAIRFNFEHDYNGQRATFNVVGFYKDKKSDGSPAKSPFYSLGNDKPAQKN